MTFLRRAGRGDGVFGGRIGLGLVSRPACSKLHECHLAWSA